MSRTRKEQCTRRQRFERLQHTGRVMIGDWVRFYNRQRPHRALSTRAPAEACALDA
ncbi:Integrase core domain-containing protein [Azotobacter beijerinckii]|uniref:Integrase core domain-containing protein n=1 Tax=Azotobacter beijerinckii TaxID=170623 RepID=A0A1H9LHY4_9GAMM|nr:Integrase core domain-containing protein [Azotobacter beijerinckii]